MLKIPRINFKKGVRSLTLVFVAVATAIAPLTIYAPTALAVAEPAPVNVRSFVGGNSIALLWNPATGSTPTQYKVYRNGSLLATVPPSVVNANSTTQRYIDATVTNGTTYQYQVSALNAASEESALTATHSVTQPASPVAVPTITIASGTPSDLVTYMNNSKALLEAWYPKIVTQLGSVTGTPTSLTIDTDPNAAGGIAAVSGTTITIDEDYARAHLNDQAGTGVWIHEAVHVAQQYVKMPGWITEGVADYVRYFLYNDATVANPINDTWQDGYQPVAYFLNWIVTTFNKPNFVKDMHAMGRVGNNEAFFQNQTGLSVGELWREMTLKKIHSPMTLKNSSTKCIDVPSSSQSSGVDYQLYTCNSSSAQTFIFVPDTYSPGTQGYIKTQTKCMDVQGSGTTDGTRVWQFDCTGSAAQKWVIQSNGTLKNPNSNKCVQPVGGGTTNGTKLEIRTCAGTAVQQWGVRPMSIMQNMGSTTTAINYCIDSANGNPAPGFSSIARNGACDYSNDQLLEWVQSSPGSTQGTYRLYNRTICLATNGAGTANGTQVVFTACSGNANQLWIRQSDTTLKDVNSGKCLQPQGGSTAVNANLVIETCTTGNIQKWKFATM